MLALPGMKLGWIGVSGEAALVQKSMRTLEMMSDTFLPVNELVQFAVPTLLRGARPFMADYRAKVAGCRGLAVKALSQARNLSVVPPVGGFYAAVRWTGPERDEEQLLIDLLKESGFWRIPGYFYEMPGTHLVMTFVEELEVLARGIGSTGCVCRRVEIPARLVPKSFATGREAGRFKETGIRLAVRLGGIARRDGVLEVEWLSSNSEWKFTAIQTTIRRTGSNIRQRS